MGTVLALSPWGMEIVFLHFGIVGVLGLYAFRNRWQRLDVETTT